MAITKVISPIPPAPKRSDPEHFDERADEFLGRIETLDDDLNDWAGQCNATAEEVNANASIAEEARIVCEAIGASNGYKGEWDDTTVYSKGDVVSFSNLLWLSKKDNNQGNQPSESSEWWLKVQRTFHSIELSGDVSGDVVIGDPVYLDPVSGLWKKAIYYPTQGVFVGSGVVVAGKANIPGANFTAGRTYFNREGVLSVSGKETDDIVGYALSSDSLIVAITNRKAHDPVTEHGRLYVFRNTIKPTTFYVLTDNLVAFDTDNMYVVGEVVADGVVNEFHSFSWSGSLACLCKRGSDILFGGATANEIGSILSGTYRTFDLSSDIYPKRIISDGTNLFVAGYSYRSTYYRPSIVKLNNDLDYLAGYELDSTTTNNQCRYAALALDQNGNVFAVGYFYYNGQWNLLISRYSSDLTTSTHKIIPLSGSSYRAMDLAIDDSGNIYVVVTDFQVVPSGSVNSRVALVLKLPNDLSSILAQTFIYYKVDHDCDPLGIALGNDSVFVLCKATTTSDSGLLLIELDSSLAIQNGDYFVGINKALVISGPLFVGGNVVFAAKDALVVKHENVYGTVFSSHWGREWKEASVSTFNSSYSLSDASPTVVEITHNSSSTSSLTSCRDVKLDIFTDYWE